MAKKGAPVTELHSKPRKINPEGKKRIAIVLTNALVMKLKIRSYETGATLQKYVSDVLTKHLGD